MKNYILITSLIVFLSCSSDTTTNLSIHLTGNWRADVIQINGENMEDISLYNISSFLGFRNENQFYLDYNGGVWELEDEYLLLKYSDGSIFRKYEILESTSTSLILETQIPEYLYYFDFDGIANDELFTLTEHYYKL